jgi:hypothetical protein
MSDVAAMIEALQRRLIKAGRKASWVEEELDALEGELGRVRDALAGVDSLPGRPTLGKPTHEDGRLLQQMAQAGVASLEITRGADDSAGVRVGGSKWFRLSPMVADLLSLISSQPPADDGLAGWCPLPDVVRALSKTAGRPVSKRSVIQLLWRLRRRLRKSGENPFLIQVSRRHGVRFALRREDTTPSSGSMTRLLGDG